MASELPTSVLEGFSSESEIKIVLLGDTRVDKSELFKLILGCKTLKGQEIGLCTLYKTEDEGRKISVVDTPGWDPITIEQTAENIKTEIVRSWSLCPPGPDVFLLVIPAKQEPSMCEISEAQKHMELLSERVWKHTIVLFDCKENIEKCVINEHKKSAKTILKKCKKRYSVFRRGFSQMTEKIELFKKIDDLMKENNREFFMPQIYYEKIQPGTQEFDEGELRQRRGSIEKDCPGLRKGNDTGEGELRQRRGSIEKDRPDLRKENDTEEKKETVEAAKPGLLDDVAALRRTIKPISVILMAIFGALIGAVAGSEHGVLGACAGLVSGIIVGVLLAVLTVYICTYIYS